MSLQLPRGKAATLEKIDHALVQSQSAWGAKHPISEALQAAKDCAAFHRAGELLELEREAAHA